MSFPLLAVSIEAGFSPVRCVVLCFPEKPHWGFFRLSCQPSQSPYTHVYQKNSHEATQHRDISTHIGGMVVGNTLSELRNKVLSLFLVTLW